MRKIHCSDHLEIMVIEALQQANIEFTHESENKVQGLDFCLTGQNIYIEVKRYHSDRTVNQLTAHDNIILLQGIEAVRLFTKLITKAI